MVVLTGENGAGKTNVLEALSLLAPGRGLRRAELADCARIGGRGGFAVSVEIEAEGHRVQLGVGLDPPEDADDKQARRFRINRMPAPSGRALADHLRLVWQTPAMDQLFTGPAGDRRKFLDRLVLAVDPDHGARVNALERDRKSTRLNSSHANISYAVFCLKKKKSNNNLSKMTIQPQHTRKRRLRRTLQK